MQVEKRQSRRVIMAGVFVQIQELSDGSYCSITGERTAGKDVAITYVLLFD